MFFPGFNDLKEWKNRKINRGVVSFEEIRTSFLPKLDLEVLGAANIEIKTSDYNGFESSKKKKAPSIQIKI